MSTISPQDLERLAGLQGYDLTLEIDVLARKYGMSPEQIVTILRAFSQPQTKPSLSFQHNLVILQWRDYVLITILPLVQRINVRKSIKPSCVLAVA